MIFAITNQKGGVGKTTTTLNLAAYLAEMGKTVLLVDLDPQANLSSGIGINVKEIKKSIYNVLLEEVPIAEIINHIDKYKLDIAPANLSLAGAEVELVSAMSRESILLKNLKSVANKYDYIFIDCPPSLGLITINALVAADAVLIPVQSEYFALEGLGQLLKTINLVKTKLNSKISVGGIVITMYDARTNLAKQVVEELVKNFSDKVFNTIIPRNVRLSEAPSYGEPINIFDPNSQGARSYKRLASEFAQKFS